MAALPARAEHLNTPLILHGV